MSAGGQRNRWNNPAFLRDVLPRVLGFWGLARWVVRATKSASALCVLNVIDVCKLVLARVCIPFMGLYLGVGWSVCVCVSVRCVLWGICVCVNGILGKAVGTRYIGKA